MASSSDVTAAVIVIGNEILSGRTQDLNLSFLALQLNEAGIRLKEARVVQDEDSDIIEAVNSCRARYDYVLTTGGIGPTHDDITAAAIAKAFGVPLVRNPEAQRALEDYYPPEKRIPARMRMADIPEGATLISNPVSKAPGFQIENVFVLAGVPAIVKAMWPDVLPRLEGGQPLLSRSLTAWLPESEMASGLTDLQERYYDLSIGSYPFWRAGRLGATIVMRGPLLHRLEAAKMELASLMRGLGAEPEEETP